MAGYTDGFTAVNGDLINAPLFQQEYTNLGIAFDASTGHKHDGSAGEGVYIPLIADGADLNEVLVNGASNLIDFSVNVAGTKTSQLTIADGAVLPTTTNDIDLGSPALMFKDSYLTTLAIGTGIVVDTILDDDTMAANSATALVSQQSLVAYTGTTIGNAIIDGGAY